MKELEEIKKKIKMDLFGVPMTPAEWESKKLHYLKQIRTSILLAKALQHQLDFVAELLNPEYKTEKTNLDLPTIARKLFEQCSLYYFMFNRKFAAELRDYEEENAFKLLEEVYKKMK